MTSGVYVGADDWVATVESSVLLAVPSSWVFMMFTHVVVGAAAGLQTQCFRIARVEFAFFTLERFLLACRVGLTPNELYDTATEQGFLVPLPQRLRELIDRLGFMWCVGGGVGFDQGLALLTYRRSAEVDWTGLAGVAHIFLHYAWEAGVITSVPARTDTRGTTNYPANRLVWLVAEANRATIVGCRAEVDAADREEAGEGEEVPPEVPQANDDDGDPDEGYEDVSDVVRFLGYDSRVAEEVLLGRVGSVCRRHNAEVPRTVDGVVGCVDRWLTSFAKATNAANAMESDLAVADERERSLTEQVAALKVESKKHAAATVASSHRNASRSREVQQLRADRVATATRLRQLSDDAAASIVRVQALEREGAVLRARVERADADAAQRSVLMRDNAQLLTRMTAELRRRIPYVAVADGIGELRGTLGGSIREAASTLIEDGVRRLEEAVVARVLPQVDAQRQVVDRLYADAQGPGAGATGGPTGGGAAGGAAGAGAAGGSAGAGTAGGAAGNGTTGGA